MVVLRHLCAVTVVCAVAFVFPAVGQDPNRRIKADDKNFDGTYVATAGERNGKPLTDDQVKGVTFRFDGEKMVITDRTGKEIHKCTHTIDTSSKPWKISMKVTETSGDKKVDGLIERTGDTIRFIYPLAGGETPTEFKTKDNQEMYTLKLQK